MLNKVKFASTALAAVAAAVLSITPLGAANDGAGALKLEGAWIAKVPGTPVQWSYVVSPDASGRRASFHGSIDVGFGNPFGADHNSPLLGEAVMTGPDTAKFNSLWYGIGPSGVVYIGVNTGEIKFIGQGESIGTHHMSFYLPSADGDGDGLPDPGTTPAFTRGPFNTIDTRLPLPR